MVEYKLSCEMEAHVEVTTSKRHLFDCSTFKDKRHLLILVAMTEPCKKAIDLKLHYVVDHPKVGE